MICSKKLVLGMTLAALNLAATAAPNKALSQTDSQLIAKAVQVKKINLNTATADDIAGAVKGIGKKRAEAIVNYRQANGKFKDFLQLAAVKGISKRFIEQNRPALEKVFSIE